MKTAGYLATGASSATIGTTIGFTVGVAELMIIDATYDNKDVMIDKMKEVIEAALKMEKMPKKVSVMPFPDSLVD